MKFGSVKSAEEEQPHDSKNSGPSYPLTGDEESRLFEPDILLSFKYSDAYRRKSQLEPEKRLMLAVLEDAVACFKNYAVARDRRQRKLFQDTEEWLMEEEESEWLFSFENVCEALGLNPDWVRMGLLRWIDRVLRGKPAMARMGGEGSKGGGDETYAWRN